MKKKKWKAPVLIAIKRGKQEGVLKCCKNTSTAGPGKGTCDQHALCCFDYVGS